MASTVSLLDTINAVRPFVRRVPLTFSGSNQPALTMGDWVRNFILAAPFAWRWNRASYTRVLTVSPVTQDYVANLPDFGWLEQATITDLNDSPPTLQLDNRMTLAEELSPNQPASISAQFDDGAGNITFRLLPPPDQAYTLVVNYQKASPKFTSLSSTWAPIPDYFNNIFFQGVLAKAYEYFGDDRFPVAMQTFVRSVVAINGGLSQTQIDSILLDQMNATRTIQSDIQQFTTANQARASL